MRPIPCVGGLVYDSQGRLLLVLRAHEPARGTWSVPGGRVEPGEDAAAAVAQELREETGLGDAQGGWRGWWHRAAPGGGTFVIPDCVCEVAGGARRPSDDADDARQFSAADLAAADPGSFAPASPATSPPGPPSPRADRRRPDPHPAGG